MTSSGTSQESASVSLTSPPHHEKKRTLILTIITLIFIVTGVVFFLYWFIWGRFEESTTDAYVDGNMIELTSQISGSVTTIYAENTDLVEQNQILVELDKTDREIALETSKALLAETLREVIKMFATVKELEASIESKEALLIRAIQDFEHRKNLVDSGGVSREDFEHAEAELKSSLASLISVQYSYLAALAQIQNTTILTHPLVEKAKEQLKASWVNLQRCKIASPVKGIIAKRNVQVGETITAQTPLMAVIPLDQIWAEANFKEVQLANMRIGQPVKVTADFYGHNVLFHGKVVGLEAGTGSVFSVLPPQNATGNWIKIVQRLSVKISLPIEEIEKHPLRLGLSLEVKVDTHNREGKVLPEIAPQKPVYQTDIFASQICGAEELIEQIIKENIDPSLLDEE